MDKSIGKINSLKNNIDNIISKDKKLKSKEENLKTQINALINKIKSLSKPKIHKLSNFIIKIAFTGTETLEKIEEIINQIEEKVDKLEHNFDPPSPPPPPSHSTSKKSVCSNTQNKGGRRK